MPLNEENNFTKKRLSWTNRKYSNIEEYKEELIKQGKCLCGQYIRARLRRAGVLNRKVMQRLRAILEPSSNVIYEIFPALNSMGEEIERMHPRLYINVSRQLLSAPFGELQDGDQAPILLNLIAKELFKNNHNNNNNNNNNNNCNNNITNINYNQNNNNSITWGKIISLFAVCGGFAIDCVRQGHPDYLQYLIDGIKEIIEDDLIQWLIDNNGWYGLQKHCIKYKLNNSYSNLNINLRKFSIIGWLTIFIILSSIIYFITNLFKFIGYHLQSFLF